MKTFFDDDRNMLVIVDRMANAYSMTPYEVVTTMSIYEFTFNMAVMYVAELERQKEREKAKAKEPEGKEVDKSGHYRKFGTAYEVKTKRVDESNEQPIEQEIVLEE